MRKLLLLSNLLLPLILTAQLFPKAPIDTRPIKQITEWTTFVADKDNPEETIKDAIYNFRRDGQLDIWETNNSDNEVYHYKYDPQGRIEKVTIKNDGQTRNMTYQYFEDRRMAEIEEKDIDLRNIQYFNNKGLLVEEKSFWRGVMTQKKWVIDTRTVFNYDAQDSLFGEMVYNYHGFDQPEKNKVVHSYHPTLNKKDKTIFYDSKGKPLKEIKYTYEPSGRLLKKETLRHDNGFFENSKYLYREGKIWQIITVSKNYKIEKVFKNGRLVRLKEFDKDGQQLWFTDYQYEFY